MNFFSAFTWAMKRTGVFMGNATTPMVTDTTTKVSLALVSMASVLLLTYWSNNPSSTLFCLFTVEVTVRGKVGPPISIIKKTSRQVLGSHQTREAECSVCIEWNMMMRLKHCQYWTLRCFLSDVFQPLWLEHAEIYGRVHTHSPFPDFAEVCVCL